MQKNNFLNLQKIPKLKILDILIIVLVLVFSIFLIKSNTHSLISSDKVLVQANQQKYEFSLLKDGIYTVQGQIGQTKIQIIAGKVCIIESACPNKTCIKQGYCNSIVCLPNKVYVQVCTNEQGEFDAIVR